MLLLLLVGVAGVWLDIRRCRGCLPHPAQDLGIERGIHFVQDFTPALSNFPLHSPVSNLVLHENL